MSALDIAAETGHWRAAQILLAADLPRIGCASKFLLGLQRVALVKNGVPVYARNARLADRLFEL